TLPHLPHEAAETRVWSGVQTPFSLSQRLHSVHLPSSAQTREVVPHLPHDFVSLAPAEHGVEAQAPYWPQLHVEVQVRCLLSPSAQPSVDTVVSPVLHTPSALHCVKLPHPDALHVLERVPQRPHGSV